MGVTARFHVTRPVVWVCLLLAGAVAADEAQPTERSSRSTIGAAGLGLIGFGLGHYYAGDQGSGNTFLALDGALAVGSLAYMAFNQNDFWGVDDLNALAFYLGAKPILSLVQAVDAGFEAAEYNRRHAFAAGWQRPALGFGFALSDNELFGRAPTGLDPRMWTRYQSVQPTWELRFDPLTPGAMLGYRGSF